MEYDKEKGKMKYYSVETPKEEKQKIPQFKDIFYDLPVSGAISSPGVYHEGVVYFPCLDTYVYAVDATSGELVWKFKTGGPNAWCTPLVHNDRVYFGSTDRHFYCLNLEGELLWKKHTGDVIVAPAVGIGDNIYISNGAGYLFCFSLDGEEKWKFRMGDGATSPVTAVNDMIFIGSYDGHVYALEDGKMKWRFRTGERVISPSVYDNGMSVVTNAKRSFDEIPEVENPLLYCASYNNYLYALNQEGREIWKFNCNSSVPGGIGGENGIIYAGTMDGYLHAVDAFTGMKKWSFLTDGMVVGGAEVSGKDVYVVSMDQKLYCLTEQGEKKWDFLTGGPISARPLIVGDKIYFGSADSFLYCLNRKKRSVEWTFQVSLPASDIFVKSVGDLVNAFIEYDKKIFKVWVPETQKRTTQSNISHGYQIPQGLQFGGEMAYKEAGVYGMKKKKKDPYDK